MSPRNKTIYLPLSPDLSLSININAPVSQCVNDEEDQRGEGKEEVDDAAALGLIRGD